MDIKNINIKNTIKEINFKCILKIYVIDIFMTCLVVGIIVFVFGGFLGLLGMSIDEMMLIIEGDFFRILMLVVAALVSYFVMVKFLVKKVESLKVNLIFYYIFGFFIVRILEFLFDFPYAYDILVADLIMVIAVMFVYINYKD